MVHKLTKMQHVFAIGAGRYASEPLKERFTKWLRNDPGNILAIAGGAYAASLRDPATYVKFSEEFAAVEPTVDGEAERENLLSSAAPIVDIISMYAKKELTYEVDRIASKAAVEAKDNVVTGVEMYNVVSTAYGLKTRVEDRATTPWLEEARKGLMTGNLKMVNTMLEKLTVEGVNSEELSIGVLGEISFKYRAQSNREIRTVGEFFIVLVRWARGVLAAGTIVVGEDGCEPGVGTMGDHGIVGTAAVNRRLHVTMTEVFALLQYHFVLADQPVEVHLSVFAEIMSGVKDKMLLEQYNFSSAVMFVLQETKPFALVARLGFTLKTGRKSTAASAKPAGAAGTTGVADVSAAAELAEQKKALKLEVTMHRQTKNDLAQKTAKIAKLEDELRQARQQTARRTPQKRERSPDRRRSGERDHYSRAKRY